jgi:alkylation response protein AidB-like acyl-CoA dehydrogenase
MNHEAAVSNAKDVADRVLAPAARQNDKEGRFSSEAIKAFGTAGLLGLMLPTDIGGSALGPRTFAAIVSTLAEADASVAMVYLMHICAAATISAARNGATVAPTLKEIGQSLGESLPTLRAQLATMQIDTDGLAARIDDLIDHLERPRDTTVLRVLESKAAAGDAAIAVTSAAMRICGGAAFAKHMSIERLFRDAHAGAVMAPTGDVLREFIGKAVLGMPLF